MSAKAESKDSLILDKVQRSKLANFRNLVQCDGVIMSDKRRGGYLENIFLFDVTYFYLYFDLFLYMVFI